MDSTFKKAKKLFVAFFSHRLVVLTLLSGILFLCVAASLSSVNTYVIHDGEDVLVYNSSINETVAAISEFGLTVDQSEYIEMPNAPEHGVAQIYIYPKKKVTLKIADSSTVLYTEKDETLQELLSSNNVSLGEHDIISVPMETKIEDGMNIEIIRVELKTVEEITEVPFSTEKRPSPQMAKGTTKTIQIGSKGAKKTVYSVKYQNGAEVSRSVVSETITKSPTTQIVEYGTKPNVKSGSVTTWSGSKLDYKNKINMTATAYTTERTSDKITATGKIAQVGYVAVDPKVIPLGSRLYIVSADGKSWCYGTAVAADTGVRGNKIDLFFNTYRECINFGRRKATVYVLK